MPQLDLVTFASQSLYVSVVVLIVYYMQTRFFLPRLAEHYKFVNKYTSLLEVGTLYALKSMMLGVQLQIMNVLSLARLQLAFVLNTLKLARLCSLWCVSVLSAANVRHITGWSLNTLLYSVSASLVLAYYKYNV